MAYRLHAQSSVYMAYKHAVVNKLCMVGCKVLLCAFKRLHPAPVVTRLQQTVMSAVLVLLHFGAMSYASIHGLVCIAAAHKMLMLLCDRYHHSEE